MTRVASIQGLTAGIGVGVGVGLGKKVGVASGVGVGKSSPSDAFATGWVSSLLL